MKFFSFRILNFKSILDSNECFVDNRTTVLAGQNESGKTNILEALSRINQSSPSFINDKNMDTGNNNETKIIYKFILNENELKAIEGIKGFPKLIKDDEHKRVIIKIVLSEGKREIVIDLNEKSIIEQEKNILREFTKENDMRFNYKNNNDETLKTIIEEYSALETFSEDKIHSLKAKYDSVRDVQEVTKYLSTIIPKFIFQRTNDELPDSFQLANLSNDVMIKRLSNYLKKDFADVFKLNGNAQQQKNTLKEYSDELNIDFETKYTQKKVNLEFDINGNTISIYVHDCERNGGNKVGKSYKFSQRSAGLRWYINFYLTICGEELKEDDVILIDEPGMYLHAKAQEEMRDKVLYDFPRQNQIIYSTHSPYLINANKLQTIRLVEKLEKSSGWDYWEETKINEKLHNYNKIDTIKPIIDAIGYGVGAELNLNTNIMLICEGVSDCLYVRALLKGIDGLGITHANGVSNIINLVLLYQGLGVKNIYVLVDSDKDGIKCRNKIIEDRILEDSHVLCTHGPKDVGKSIEDVFDRKFFLEKIMGYSKSQIGKAHEQISEELKQQKNNGGLKEGKYLLSKFFSDYIDSNNKDKILNSQGETLIENLKNICQTKKDD